MDPPDGILDEGDENHGRKRGGHDEGFDDNDGPIHNQSEITVFSETSQMYPETLVTGLHLSFSFRARRNNSQAGPPRQTDWRLPEFGYL